MKYLLTFYFLLSCAAVFGQAPFDNLVNQIEEQEFKFPFPQKDVTITVGEIDINNNQPVIHYLVPVLRVDHIVDPGSKESSRDWGVPGPNRTIIVGVADYINTRYSIDVNVNLNFKLRFTVKNWVPAASTVSVSIGGQVETINNGQSEIVFSNVRFIDPSIVCYTAVPPPVRYSPLATKRGNFEYLHIDWNLAGAGVVTMPVLPVKVIYVPVADSKKTNTASLQTSNAQGYNTSFSITSVNDVTTPVPTTISTIDDIAGDIKQTSSVLGSIPVLKPYSEALGKISDAVIAALGSNTITRTVSNSVTNTQSYSVSDAETQKIVAKASNGGPGEGDVICFYTNIKLLWFESQGVVKLTVLGYDPPLRTPSAAQLKSVLTILSTKPAGTIDTTWHVNVTSIRALLALDPFTGPGGSTTQLDPVRFRPAFNPDGTPAVFQNGGADETITVTHQVVQSDFQSSANTLTTIETDKAGFLSFLGIGETENKTVKSSYAKSTSTQQTVGQTITQDYTLHGDGMADHYTCEVYFDTVFGTFAFRDGANEMDAHNGVQGTVTDAAGNILANTAVRLQVGDRIYLSKTDQTGKFRFALPVGSQRSAAKVISGINVIKVD